MMRRRSPHQGDAIRHPPYANRFSSCQISPVITREIYRLFSELLEFMHLPQGHSHRVGPNCGLAQHFDCSITDVTSSTALLISLLGVPA
jgi:hypothetical protein